MVVLIACFGVPLRAAGAMPADGPAAAQAPGESAPAATERPAARLVLVVDNSASMRVHDPGGLVKEGLLRLVAGIPASDRAAAVVFDETVRVAAPLRVVGDAGVRDGLAQAVSGLGYGGRYTNIPAAIERAMYELQAADGEPGLSAIVLVTDGIIDVGDPGKDAAADRWLREQLLPDCKRRGIRVFGVAFTEAADYKLLQTMAFATDGAYFRILKPADAAGVFDRLEASIARPAPAAPPPPVRPDPPPPQVVTVPVETRSPFAWLVGVPGIIMALGLIIVAITLAWRAAPSRRESAGKLPPEPPPGPDPPPAHLIDAEGFAHPVTRAVTRIGRDPKTDIVIEDRTVSANHARVDWRDGEFRVVDLRSLNGTFLNGERIKGEAILRHGDVVRFHSHDFRFRTAAGEQNTTGTVLAHRTLLAMPSTAPEGTCKDHPGQALIARCMSCGEAGCRLCLRLVSGSDYACEGCP